MDDAPSLATRSLPQLFSSLTERTLLVLTGLLLLAGPMGPNARPANATPPDSTTVELGENSDMFVEGTSNVHAWEMNVESFNGTVVLGDEDGPIPSIQSVNVTVPVEALVTDRSTMQEKAHKALKKKEHPEITFVSDDVTTSAPNDGSFSIVATGDLTVAGETKTVELKAEAARQDDGTYAVDGKHSLKLSTFDIERPSALFGALKVDDEIAVDFDVVLPHPSE